jgi:hypothetical protein
LADLLGGPNAIEFGEQEIHEDDVRTGLPGQANTLLTIGRFAHDFQLRIVLEEHSQAATDH